MSSLIAILIVVVALVFGLFIVAPLLLWIVTAFDRPALHWWERS